MTNQDKFKALVSEKNTNAITQTLQNKENRDYLRASQNIALKIMDRLDELSWTQRKLAAEMGMSPQQVNRILRGKINLTLMTIVRLERILKVSFLNSFDDDTSEDVISFSLVKENFNIPYKSKGGKVLADSNKKISLYKQFSSQSEEPYSRDLKFGRVN